MLSCVGTLKNGPLGSVSTSSLTYRAPHILTGLTNGQFNSTLISSSNPTSLTARFLATRARAAPKFAKKSNSQASPNKRWREAPLSAGKKSSPSGGASSRSSRHSSSKASSIASKQTQSSPKNASKSSKSNTKSQSSSKPAIRPHIARDLARIESARHKIRKVTGEVDPTVPGATVVTADGKTKFNQKFAKLQLMGPLLRALDDMGWEAPTPVQEGTITLGIKGSNIVASAETGTGKTAAYALPMLQRIYIRKKYEETRGITRVSAPLGIILCPTRELAEQVEDQLFELGKYVPGVRIVGISGAMKAPEVQIRELRNGVDILVATPGRLLRLLEEKTTPEDELENGDIPEFEDDVVPKRSSKRSKSAALSANHESGEMEEFDEEMDELGEEIGEIGEEVDEYDDQIGAYIANQRAQQETFDDGFGVDYDEEKDVKTMSNEEAWQSLTGHTSKSEKKQRSKRDAVYSQWDKAWAEIDSTNTEGKTRFRESLPKLPKGEAIKNSNIDLTHVRTLALDEVDRMLAMGMFPEVRHLFKAMPRPQNRSDPNRMQVFMFTATLVPRVSELIKRFAPYHVRVDLNKTMNVAERVQQHFYNVGPRRKHALLTYLLRRRGSIKGMQTLVFCRTRQRVDRLVAQLTEEGFSVAGIHGEQSLSSRQGTIDRFREGETQVLVSTEIMARGMDIPQLPVVINYDMPHSPEEYIHRIGRTARAGNTGTAISFVSSEPTLIEVGKRLVELDETHYLKSISELLDKPIRVSKVPGPWRDEAKFTTGASSSNRSSANGDEDDHVITKPLNASGGDDNNKKAKTSQKSSSNNKSKKAAAGDRLIVPATPTLDVRTQTVFGGEHLAPKRKMKYHYLEDDAELRSAVPPERNVVKRAQEVLTRLYDKKSRQVNHAVKQKRISQVEDSTTALKSQVSLRDFKEGRYEDVMDEFDTKRARKLGVAVPKNLDADIKKKREAIAKKFFKKKLERQSRRHSL